MKKLLHAIVFIAIVLAMTSAASMDSKNDPYPGKEGGYLTLNAQVTSMQCLTCGGTGRIRCYICGGTGSMQQMMPSYGGGYYYTYRPCTFCVGGIQTCGVCFGTGVFYYDGGGGGSSGGSSGGGSSGGDYVTCKSCGGSGNCKWCNGTGINNSYNDGYCAICQPRLGARGTGNCGTCRGTGRISTR